MIVCFFLSFFFFFRYNNFFLLFRLFAYWQNNECAIVRCNQQLFLYIGSGECASFGRRWVHDRVWRRCQHHVVDGGALMAVDAGWQRISILDLLAIQVGLVFLFFVLIYDRAIRITHFCSNIQDRMMILRHRAVTMNRFTMRTAICNWTKHKRWVVRLHLPLPAHRNQCRLTAKRNCSLSRTHSIRSPLVLPKFTSMKLIIIPKVVVFFF